MGDLPILGIDFGGVIVPMLSKTPHADTQFDRAFLSTRAHSGAFDAIAALVREFEGRVWVVSKAGARTEARTREWVRHHQFCEVTGLDESHLCFCRTRAEKLPICREFGITHFIDDRIHIMQILKGEVEHLYLFGDKTKNQGERHWTTLVEDWSEAQAAVMRDL